MPAWRGVVWKCSTCRVASRKRRRRRGGGVKITLTKTLTVPGSGEKFTEDILPEVEVPSNAYATDFA